MPEYKDAKGSSIDGLVGKHLLYRYNGTESANNWLYEAFYYSPTRIAYKIHSGPMGGRTNYQACDILRIRDDEEIYMVSWLEETGTVVTTVVDLERKRVHSNINFSKGHWEQPEVAHGHYKKDQWRKLASVGNGTEGRKIVVGEATIEKSFEGPGDLEIPDDFDNIETL